MEFIDILPIIYLTIGLVSTYFIGRLVLISPDSICEINS